MKIVGASQMGPMVIGSQPEVIFIIIIISVTIIMMKQGSTSDAEMLAEAAMLREHRNRLENRMVTIILSSWSSIQTKSEFIFKADLGGASKLYLNLFQGDPGGAQQAA